MRLLCSFLCGRLMSMIKYCFAGWHIWKSSVLGNNHKYCLEVLLRYMTYMLIFFFAELDILIHQQDPTEWSLVYNFFDLRFNYHVESFSRVISCSDTRSVDSASLLQPRGWQNLQIVFLHMMIGWCHRWILSNEMLADYRLH